MGCSNNNPVVFCFTRLHQVLSETSAPLGVKMVVRLLWLTCLEDLWIKGHILTNSSHWSHKNPKSPQSFTSVSRQRKNDERDWTLHFSDHSSKDNWHKNDCGNLYSEIVKELRRLPKHFTIINISKQCTDNRDLHHSPAWIKHKQLSTSDKEFVVLENSHTMKSVYSAVVNLFKKKSSLQRTPTKHGHCRSSHPILLPLQIGS